MRRNSFPETERDGTPEASGAAALNRRDSIVSSAANYPKWGKLLPLTETHWEAICLFSFFFRVSVGSGAERHLVQPLTSGEETLNSREE